MLYFSCDTLQYLTIVGTILPFSRLSPTLVKVDCVATMEGLFDRTVPSVKGGTFMKEKETNKKGYVYILTNPCFKESWVKIGKTDNLDRRIWELSQATGIPLPFELYACLETTKFSEAEHTVHKLVSCFAPEKRINPKREFFNIEPADAVEILKTVAELLDDAKIIYKQDLMDTTVINNKKQNKKSPWTTFPSMGLNKGDQIIFNYGDNLKATVSGNRTVIFENQEYFLTPLAKILAQRAGLSEQEAQNIGSGFDVFKYDDQDITLRARWVRLNQVTK